MQHSEEIGGLLLSFQTDTDFRAGSVPELFRSAAK
jgi:hypothetical protein